DLKSIEIYLCFKYKIHSIISPINCQGLFPKSFFQLIFDIMLNNLAICYFLSTKYILTQSSLSCQVFFSNNFFKDILLCYLKSLSLKMYLKHKDYTTLYCILCQAFLNYSY